MRVIAFLAILLALAIVVALFALSRCSSETSGSRIVPLGDLSVSEAQSMLDDEVEKSRITVSLAPSPQLASDGSLDMNFIVAPGNNGYSERFEIEQDGSVVYKSQVVSPGNMVKSIRVPSAHAGAAVATVYAVDEAGADHGNPVSVELTIVDRQA